MMLSTEICSLWGHPADGFSWGPFPGQALSFHQHRPCCSFLSTPGRCWEVGTSFAPGARPGICHLAMIHPSIPLQMWYLPGSRGLIAVWQWCSAELGAPGLCNRTVVKRFNFFMLPGALCQFRVKWTQAKASCGKAGERPRGFCLYGRWLTGKQLMVSSPGKSAGGSEWGTSCARKCCCKRIEGISDGFKSHGVNKKGEKSD